MFKKFLPQQENFFLLFQQIAEELQKSTNVYQHLLNSLPNGHKHSLTIEEHKHRANTLTRNVLEILHKTFITPFDRHDIYNLTGEFTTAFDLINRTAQRVVMYQLDSIPSEISSIGALCACAAGLIKGSIDHLNSLKNSSNILKLCGEVYQIQGEADKILQAGVTQLFRDINDVKELLITKEIYEYSEAIIYQFESIANNIECIVLEYS